MKKPGRFLLCLPQLRTQPKGGDNIEFTKRDMTVLADLYRWRVKSGAQITQRHFAGSKASYRRMKALEQAGYCEQAPYFAPVTGRTGTVRRKAGVYYQLTEKGVQVVAQAMGLREPRRARNNRVDPQDVEPRLALNDLVAMWEAAGLTVIEGREAKARWRWKRWLPCDAVLESDGGKWLVYLMDGWSQAWEKRWKAVDFDGLTGHLLIATNAGARDALRKHVRPNGLPGEVYVLDLQRAGEAAIALTRDPQYVYRKVADSLGKWRRDVRITEDPEVWGLSAWRVARRGHVAQLVEVISGNLRTWKNVSGWHHEIEREAGRPEYLIVAVSDEDERQELAHEIPTAVQGRVSVWLEGQLLPLAGRTKKQ